MASLDPTIKVHQILREMSIGQIPNHAKFGGNPTGSVRDIRDCKFVLPKKVDQNSPKLLKTCYSLKLLIMPISLRLVKPPWRKALQKFFFTPSIFWLLRGTPGPKVWVVGYTNPPLATCKIASRSDDPSPR